MVGPGGLRTSNQTVMSGGKPRNLQKSRVFNEYTCTDSLMLGRLFLGRNWCGNQNLLARTTKSPSGSSSALRGAGTGGLCPDAPESSREMGHVHACLAARGGGREWQGIGRIGTVGDVGRFRCPFAPYAYPPLQRDDEKPPTGRPDTALRYLRTVAARAGGFVLTRREPHQEMGCRDAHPGPEGHLDARMGCPYAAGRTIGRQQLMGEGAENSHRDRRTASTPAMAAAAAKNIAKRSASYAHANPRLKKETSAIMVSSRTLASNPCPPLCRRRTIPSNKIDHGGGEHACLDATG